MKLKQIAYSGMNDFRPSMIGHLPRYTSWDGHARTWIGRTDLIPVHSNLPQNLRSAETAILSMIHNGYL